MVTTTKTTTMDPAPVSLPSDPLFFPIFWLIESISLEETSILYRGRQRVFLAICSDENDAMQSTKMDRLYTNVKGTRRILAS